MPIDFPDSPTNGQSYSANSKTWTFDGTSWVLLQGEAIIASGSITEAKIADSAVTTDKIANNAVTSAKIASNAVSQAKLASNTSGVTITTSSNRATDVPSPFTGQLIFETDTLRMKVWNGSTWLTISILPPQPPTSLSAVQSDTSVAISFTPGSDNGSAITNYEYAISTNGGVSYGSWTAFSPVDTTSPVTISGLSRGTAYYVKLRGVNAAGSGDGSSPVSFTTLDFPNAPTGLSVSSTTTTTAVISFTAPSNNGGTAITNYEYSTNNSTWTALSPADALTPVTISGLSSNTSYTLYLRAVNSVGSGTASSGVSATTLANAPTGLTAQSTAVTTATISFTAPTGSATITNYEYSTNGSTWTALSPADATTPVTVTGLTANTAYTLYLRAVNAGGSGATSSGVSVTTLATAPTSLSASTTTTTATISFTAPTGSATITNYEFSTNGSTWTALSPPDTTSPVTVTGLSAGTSYTIYLRAVNSSGSGTSSSGLAVTTLSLISIQYLVIAGGGTGRTGGSSGTYYGGGGGGAGGYRSSVSGESNGGGNALDSPLSKGAGTYTVTVGGAGGNSVFDSITATAGVSATSGVGGNAGSYGYAGGSGGGDAGGGGGGGAGSAGTNGYTNLGYQPYAGNGGAGIASSITGSSVGRAGGGGGGGDYSAGTASSGGATGGSGANATANTGGGGGGGGAQYSVYSNTAGLGGSGIVILRYLTSSASGYTVTGGTKTTSGSYTIHTFTSSGSLSIS